MVISFGTANSEKDLWVNRGQQREKNPHPLLLPKDGKLLRVRSKGCRVVALKATVRTYGARDGQNRRKKNGQGLSQRVGESENKKKNLLDASPVRVANEKEKRRKMMCKYRGYLPLKGGENPIKALGNRRKRMRSSSLKS